MEPNGKNLNELVRIKEKRTFVLNILCDCGGEFVYDVGDVGDVFSSLFSAIQQVTDYEIPHKCRKCGKTTKFKHSYPCEKSFEIGLDTSNDAIATFVAEAFEEELKDGARFEKSVER